MNQRKITKNTVFAALDILNERRPDITHDKSFFQTQSRWPINYAAGTPSRLADEIEHAYDGWWTATSKHSPNAAHAHAPE